MIQEDLKRDFSPAGGSKRVLLFSAMADKDYAAVLSLLLPHFDSAVLCRPPLARAAKLSDLKKAAGKLMPPARIRAISSPSRALLLSRRLATPRGRVLVCGSIYLLSSLRGEKEFRLAG